MTDPRAADLPLVIRQLARETAEKIWRAIDPSKTDIEDLFGAEVGIIEAALREVAAHVREQDAPYMQHRTDCKYWPQNASDERDHHWETSDAACTCGLNALRAAAIAPKEKQR